MEVDGLLLAAGAGRRAGGPKALRTDGAEQAWVLHAVDVLLAGGCRRVHVVVGAAADQVAALLVARGDDRVRVVRCPDWDRGPGASLRAGLAALAEVDAVLVHLVDLPDVGPAVVTRLRARAGRTALARATYEGRPGHPVLLGVDHLEPLRRDLTDAEGARGYLHARGADGVECGDLATGRDVDGPVGTWAEPQRA